MSAYLDAVSEFSTRVVEAAVGSLVAGGGDFLPAASALVQECARQERAMMDRRALPPPRADGREEWAARITRLEVPAATMSRIGVGNWRPLMECHQALDDGQVRSAIEALAAGRSWQPAPRTRETVAAKVADDLGTSQADR